jgi:hypothetical protein
MATVLPVRPTCRQPSRRMPPSTMYFRTLYFGADIVAAKLNVPSPRLFPAMLWRCRSREVGLASPLAWGQPEYRPACRAVLIAGLNSGSDRLVSCGTFRRSYATEGLTGCRVRSATALVGQLASEHDP